ncbi:MAG: hypothetical protein KGI71_04760 [Patescibacteria group bacterium]|nr:hypothetical protein [Patescibacteria group bacterium]
MLIARGHHASFELEDGRTVRGAGGAEILQDETGADLPKNVVLVVALRRTGKPLGDVPAEVRRHFGPDYQPLEGRATLPPLSTGWRLVGRVREARYSRRGQYDGDWEHAFGQRRLFGGRAELPSLYRRGEALKLVLGDGQWWDWRGVNG